MPLFLAPLFLIQIAVAPTVQTKITLEEVIENVRRNERLYRDVEVVMTSTYGIGDRKPGRDSVVVGRQLRTRYVSQGEWFRLEMEGTERDSKQTISRDRIRAFDGQMTRVLEQNVVGNISSGRVEDENFIRPHMFAIRHTRLPTSFSEYLSGHEAIQANPNAHWDQNLAMQVTYLGEDELEGLKCHKVHVNVVLKSGAVEPHDGRTFWLAEERNYLPVKALAYTYRFSKEIPVAQSVVNDLREIEPGVWFPFDVTHTSYNKFAIQREGRQKLQWERRYVVERVKANPKYDREFFSIVEFPDGTAMYDVKDGKITRSWRQGAPEATGGPAAAEGFQRWWILWANLAVVLLVAAIVIIRKMTVTGGTVKQ